MDYRHLAGFALAAAVWAGCISMRPISPNTRFEGQPAKELELVLPEPCEFRPGLAILKSTLSAGRYRAQLEDDEGVYFRGSDKVFIRNVIVGGSLHDGGIYLSHGRETVWVFFINFDGNLERHTLPEECRYRIELCEGCEIASR